MRTTATAAKVVRLPLSRPVKLDEGPKTVAFLQAEIFRSGWPYARIALEADVGAQTVWRIATGQTTRPAWRTIIKILMALGVDVYAHERQR